MSDLTPEQDAQRSRLEDAIREAEGVGPDFEGGLLSEWVLVSVWVDPDDGDAYMVRLASQGALKHTSQGLLFRALHEWDD